MVELAGGGRSKREKVRRREGRVKCEDVVDGSMEGTMEGSGREARWERYPRRVAVLAVRDLVEVAGRKAAWT